MKKVISGIELREAMKSAIDMLCDTVKITLGPKGNNVIIDHSNFSPFITNDGVTIAKNIESEDEVINTILELAKEASIKTNEVVGDGTTTTLVLLKSIFNEGMKLIEDGVNPIILKKELDEALKEIIKKLYIKSKFPKEKDLENIATISSNDEFIGKIVSEALISTKNKSAISIIESDNDKTLLKISKGYKFETIFASPYFLNDTKEYVIEKAKVVLFNEKLNFLEEIGFVINDIINNNNSLIVVANEYSDEVINDAISLNIENNVKIYLLKTPEYGYKSINILKDLSAITNAKIIENDILLSHDIGNTFNITINEETTTFSFISNDRIAKRIDEIKKYIEFSKSDYEKDYYLKILSMFTTSLATISVGATTITERREKKMRYDDALCAIDTAKKGILPGSGLTLLEISDNINKDNNGNKILKNVLLSPIAQILDNAGLDSQSIIDEIRKENYKIIYNVKTDNYESVRNTNIIDPTEVIINSLKNACSIAGMLLTTNSLVINEYKNNYNKEYNYNEL